MNRLTSGPLGSYTYGDAAHADAATSIGSGSGGWTASYDEVGNETCRAAPGSGQTCAGASPTGALLGYDNEERLYGWQNAQTNPTASAAYLYDGAGQRVQRVATASGATTTTSYVGKLEEVTSSGGTTTTTASYGGIAQSVNGILSYLLSDGLGSVSEAVSTAGAVTATQLYAPYGGVRYQSGTLPTDHGYTGQVSDAASTGLDYYGARYYDPVVGQFTSADTWLAGGLNAYAYVGGNPETRTDPSGHVANCVAAALDPASVTDWAGCGGDLLQGASAKIQGQAVVNVIKTAEAQYNGSGTTRFLTPDGEIALDDVTSRSALARNALESLADVRNVIPGMGKSPAASLLKDVKGVLGDAKNVKGEGPSGGRVNTAALDTSLEDAEATIRFC